MFILQHDSFGDPSDVVAHFERESPRPAAGEVVIRVEASPIHAGDLKNIAGERTMVRNVDTGSVRDIATADDMAVTLPQVPGIEGVGRIVATGAGLTSWSVGDRVFLPLQCGSWREEIAVSASRLIPAPEGDAVQLSLMVNAFTADLALRDLAPLNRGDWFVQNAANSNVGRIIIQLAAQRGIRTLNIVRRPELVEELRALGADAVVVEGPDLPRRVAEATGGATLAIGLDGVAGAATTQLAECLSNGATIANFGLMSGEPCMLPAWILHYKRIVLRGYYAGHNFFERSADEQRTLMVELARLIADGTLTTRIAARYPLRRYRDALRHAAAEGSARDGKVVFDMSLEG